MMSRRVSWVLVEGRNIVMLGVGNVVHSVGIIAKGFLSVPLDAIAEAVLPESGNDVVVNEWKAHPHVLLGGWHGPIHTLITASMK